MNTDDVGRFSPSFRTRLVPIRQDRDERIEISVRDNGIGVAENFDFKADARMGLRLIRIIGEEQLQGEVLFERKDGLSCTVRFKDNLYSKRV